MSLSKTQRNKLKKLLAQAMKARDGYKCIRCSKTTVLQTSHIYPVGREKKMEFILDNVKTLCNGCHIFWWHKHPTAAAEWIKTALPKARLDKLKKISQSTKKGVYDYEKIKEELEDAIRRYEAL